MANDLLKELKGPLLLMCLIPLVLISLTFSLYSFLSYAATSNSTITVYSGAGDGKVFYSGLPFSGCDQSKWDIAHDALSGKANYTASPTLNWVGSGCTSSNSTSIMRGFLSFDTSSLPDDAVITSAKLHIYVTGRLNSTNDGNDFFSVVQGLQDSPLILTGSDYSKAGEAINNPTEGSNRIDINNIVTKRYTIFTLDNVGISWIDKTGWTKLAVREGHDILDIWPGYKKGKNNIIHVAMSEQSKTSKDTLF